MKAKYREGSGSVSHVKNCVSCASPSKGSGVKAIKNSVGVKSAKSVKVKGAVS